MSSDFNAVRLIRVFVSSLGDVQAERDVLQEVVESINRTDGSARGFRLELFRWEEHVTPQLGPKPQQVVDSQTPEYEIYIGILAHRFGTKTGRYGSGTEKEFRDALKRWTVTGAPWILFYFSKGMVDPDALDLDQYSKVRKFCEQVETKGQGVYATYVGVRGTKDSFFEKVSEHLRKVVHRLVPPLTGQIQPRPVGDPTTYLRDLLEKTASIDIRGLQVGKGKANRFPIDDLYISLTTTHTPAAEDDQGKKRGRQRRDAELEAEFAGRAERAVPLHTALQNDRLVIVGDPGAGKTTFLRRVAHALCQTQLGEVSKAAQERLGIAGRTFPVLIRLSELAQHLARLSNDTTAPAGEDAPNWLPHYLAAVSEANNWGLDGEFFLQQLEGGLCTVLLDGLDEAPDRVVRERLSRLIENATKTYRGCRFVITSRPAGYTGEVVLPEFAHAQIDPLSEEAVDTFLSRWCQALYAESRSVADEHCGELLAALRARPDIRRMARNPVMLTALAVVHWNERRLPEQRADLYESIIRWLSRSREQRPGREKADRTVELLRELALAMQSHPDGMQTLVGKRWAAETLAAEFLMGAQSKAPKKPNYDEEAFDERESPVHEVYLDEFRITRYPVTVGQYQEFVENEGYQDDRWWPAGGFGQFSEPDDWDGQMQYPSRPVVSVSWWEVAAYCQWGGFRLPTEAEWERAARGTEGRKYPWDNDRADPSRLNFSESRIGHPTPVGIYPRGATPEGICDLAGNVWEWCADWYADYNANPASNPVGPEKATYRVFRGGGWGSNAGRCRSAYRCRSEPARRLDDLGFRVASSSVR